MNAEFNWWLLIVGLVIGGGLVWLVLLDSRRREDEISGRERSLEATWLSDALAEEGTTMSPAVAERVLQLHAEYLAASVPPVEVAAPAPAAGSAPASAPRPPEPDGPAAARLPEPTSEIDPGT